MSQENVEIVRLGYELLNGGDLDGVLQLCATDFEFRDLPALPGSGVFIGHDAFRAWHAQLLDAFEDLHFEPQEFIDAGGDRVVVPNHATGQGKGSGADVEMHFSSVWTMRAGKFAKHIAYSDHAEALEAAGLSE
jgi:ketosteroid isomerase-like protein